MRYTIALFLLAVTVNCAHTRPNPQAPDVVVLRVLAPKGCEDLGELTGESRGSLLYGDTLEDESLEDLRNVAADAGATHVVVLHVSPTAHASSTTAQAYRCPSNPDMR